MALIKVKRGTRSQIVGSSLEVGEPAFATDTKELYIGDGVSSNLIGKSLAGDLVDRPSAGINGRFYYATDEHILYVDEVTGWRLFDPYGIQGIVSITNDYTAGHYRLILANADSNNITVTLSDETIGRTYEICRTDTNLTNVVLVNGDTSGFLIGNPSQTIGDIYVGRDIVYGYLTVVWDGTEWQKVREIEIIDGGSF